MYARYPDIQYDVQERIEVILEEAARLKREHQLIFQPNVAENCKKLQKIGP